MKQLIALLLLLFCGNALFAQGAIRYHLKVTDKKNNPQPGLTVTAVETITLATLEGKTDASGIVHLNLENGNNWNISVGEIRNGTSVTTTANSFTEMNDHFFYDPQEYKRRQLQDPTRSNEGFEIIPQIVLETESPKAGFCMLGLQLVGHKGQPVVGVLVEAVDVQNKKRYQDKTDRQGRAFFMLPNKTNYDIDVEQFKNFHYADFGDETRRHGLTLSYFPTEVEETIKGDTIYQTLNASTQPSTERAFITVNVRGGDKDGIGEQTSLRSLQTGKIYFAKSNNQRQAYFLVPVGQVYMVDFPFERDVDAVTTMNSRGLSRGEIGVTYRPNPRLQFPERFIPTPATLVVNPFENFLQRVYTKPKDKAFELKISPIVKINKNSREALFQLTLAGSDSYGQGARLPLNLALVLDKSGSMYSDDRMGALKRSLMDLRGLLQPQDQVSIVLFDDEAVLVPDAANSQATLNVVIQNYLPNGGTDIFKGLKKGVEGVRRHFDPKKENKVIVLTDGYDSNPPEEVTDYVEKQYKEGIEFSAIGMGDGYNQSLLELIARKGNGQHSYVVDSSDLSGSFTQAFGRYIAKNVEIEIYYDEKLIFSNLFGFPVKSEGNKKVTFDLPNISAGTNRVAFLKFKLNEPSAAIEAKPLIVKMRYLDVVQNKEVTVEQKVQLQWTDETATQWLLEEEERKLYCIAVMNQSLKVMADAHAVGNSKEAKQAVESGIRQMRELYPNESPAEVRALFEEMNMYVENFMRMEKNLIKN